MQQHSSTTSLTVIDRLEPPERAKLSEDLTKKLHTSSTPDERLDISMVLFKLAAIDRDKNPSQVVTTARAVIDSYQPTTGSNAFQEFFSTLEPISRDLPPLERIALLHCGCEFAVRLEHKSVAQDLLSTALTEGSRWLLSGGAPTAAQAHAYATIFLPLVALCDKSLDGGPLLSNTRQMGQIEENCQKLLERYRSTDSPTLQSALLTLAIAHTQRRDGERNWALEEATTSLENWPTNTFTSPYNAKLVEARVKYLYANLAEAELKPDSHWLVQCATRLYAEAPSDSPYKAVAAGILHRNIAFDNQQKPYTARMLLRLAMSPCAEVRRTARSVLNPSHRSLPIPGEADPQIEAVTAFWLLINAGTSDPSKRTATIQNLIEQVGTGMGQALSPGPVQRWIAGTSYFAPKPAPTPVQIISLAENLIRIGGDLITRGGDVPALKITESALLALSSDLDKADPQVPTLRTTLLFTARAIAELLGDTDRAYTYAERAVESAPAATDAPSARLKYRAIAHLFRLSFYRGDTAFLATKAKHIDSLNTVTKALAEHSAVIGPTSRANTALQQACLIAGQSSPAEHDVCESTLTWLSGANSRLIPLPLTTRIDAYLKEQGLLPLTPAKRTEIFPAAAIDDICMTDQILETYFKKS